MNYRDIRKVENDPDVRIGDSRKKIVNDFLNYMTFTRKSLSWAKYWYVRIFQLGHYWRLPDVWTSVKNLPMKDYSDFIMTYPYKADRIDWDFTLQEPNYFFLKDSDLPERLRQWVTRDCDDFSHMWLYWAKENGYKGYEIGVIDALSLQAHAFAILEKDGKFYECNYHWNGVYDSFQKAVDASNKEMGYTHPYWTVYNQI